MAADTVCARQARASLTVSELHCLYPLAATIGARLAQISIDATRAAIQHDVLQCAACLAMGGTFGKAIHPRSNALGTEDNIDCMRMTCRMRLSMMNCAC
jgi:hypothetical protein